MILKQSVWMEVIKKEHRQNWFNLIYDNIAVI